MIGKRVAPGRAEQSICILIDRSFAFMPIYPLEKKDAETAARFYSDLRKAGKLIGNGNESESERGQANNAWFMF